MKVNQVFYYHPEKAHGVRTTLLFELYQTLSQLGAYNYQSISAARRVGLTKRDYKFLPLFELIEYARLCINQSRSSNNYADYNIQQILTAAPAVLQSGHLLLQP